MRKLRLVMACSSLCLGKGGSERVVIDLATEMTSRGHEVLLLSCMFSPEKTEPAFPLPPGVRHLCVSRRGRHADIRHLREFLLADKTDVFLSLQSDDAHLLWSMVCMGSGIPFICSEQADPVYIETRVWNRPGRMAALAGADCIHDLLPIHAGTVPEQFRHKTRVIPNAAPQYPIQADPVGEGRKTILYLARFADPKRPAMLLDAFRLIMDKYPDWDITMWGHGIQEKLVRRKIASFHMEDRVALRGVCHDAGSAFASAQIYCLPSYIEGLPVTVLEAMCAGLPVVGFGACRGVAGVVENGKTGLLAAKDNAASLSQCLDRLMSDPELRKQMGAAAKLASADYSPEKVFGQWEELFYEMAEIKGNTIMDAMYHEPFASRATLSAAARREWLYRNFGETMPWSAAWCRERIGNIIQRAIKASKGLANA